LTVTEQRLMELGEVAVAVVADDPQPERRAAAAASAAGKRSGERITIGWSDGLGPPNRAA
jgi:hypothetical protein